MILLKITANSRSQLRQANTIDILGSILDQPQKQSLSQSPMQTTKSHGPTSKMQLCSSGMISSKSSASTPLNNIYMKAPNTIEKFNLIKKIQFVPKTPKVLSDQKFQKLLDERTELGLSMVDDYINQQFSITELQQQIDYILTVLKDKRLLNVTNQSYNQLQSQLFTTASVICRQFYIYNSSNDFHPSVVLQASLFIAFKQHLLNICCDNKLMFMVQNLISQKLQELFKGNQEYKRVLQETEQCIFEQLNELHIDQYVDISDDFQNCISQLLGREIIVDYCRQVEYNFRTYTNSPSKLRSKSVMLTPQIEASRSESSMMSLLCQTPIKSKIYSSYVFSLSHAQLCANTTLSQLLTDVYYQIQCTDYAAVLDSGDLLALCCFILLLDHINSEHKVQISINLVQQLFTFDCEKLCVNFIGSLLVPSYFGLKIFDSEELISNFGLKKLKTILEQTQLFYEEQYSKKNRTQLYCKQPGSFAHTLLQHKVLETFENDQVHFEQLQNIIRNETDIERKQELQIQVDQIYLRWSDIGGNYFCKELE
ncbi:Cyclin-like_superfamily [Hexamita inflata]|uniref:Cyclin-like superfamily n=1 Tax=Hexamita inflata TaxID=28002 RepID=A0AA86PIL0_9EUKA|nr:Cyclin-like superfamily [Hexamita inflata]